MGQYLLVTWTVKFAGSSFTVSLPCGRSVELPASVIPAEEPPPQAVSNRAPSAASVTARRQSVAALTGVLPAGLRADDGEVPVQLDVDLAAVVAGDLDLVVALLVADLGAGHATASGLGESGLARLLQGVAGDGDVRALLGVGAAGGGRDPRAGCDDGRGAGHDDERADPAHGEPPREREILRSRSCPGDLTAA